MAVPFQTRQLVPTYLFFSALLPFKHENIDKTATFRVVLTP